MTGGGRWGCAIGLLVGGLFAFSSVLADCRIAIDIGHSPARPGALSASGVWEYRFNERFARELVSLGGGKKGLDLFLLNPAGEELSHRRRLGLAAKRGAEVLLSIHHDSANPRYLQTRLIGDRPLRYTDRFEGYSLFVSSLNPQFADGRRLADLIGSNLRATGRAPTLHHAEPIPGEGRPLLDRRLGIYDAPFGVLRGAAIPAVLLEVGVILNPAEEQRLDTATYRRAIQGAVLEAVERYCE